MSPTTHRPPPIPDTAPAEREPALGPAGYWYIACASRALGARPLPCRAAGVDLTLRREAGSIVPEPADLRVVEADHYVWVFVGATNPQSGPPPVSLFARKGYAFKQRSVPIRADYRLVLENSLDLAHSSFVHPLTQPTWFLHRLAPGRAVMEVIYHPTYDGLQVEGRLGKRAVFRQSFSLPDRMQLLVLPETPFEVEVVVHHVPETARTSRLEVAIASPAHPWASPVPHWAPKPLLIHWQDIRIVEAQQAAMDAGPPIHERHCEADAYTLLLRRILAASLHGSWAPGEDGERTIRVRL